MVITFKIFVINIDNTAKENYLTREFYQLNRRQCRTKAPKDKKPLGQKLKCEREQKPHSYIL